MIPYKYSENCSKDCKQFYIAGVIRILLGFFDKLQ